MYHCAATGFDLRGAQATGINYALVLDYKYLNNYSCNLICNNYGPWLLHQVIAVREWFFLHAVQDRILYIIDRAPPQGKMGLCGYGRLWVCRYAGYVAAFSLNPGVCFSFF